MAKVQPRPQAHDPQATEAEALASSSSSASSSSPASAPADDLEILVPEVRIEIGNPRQAVTVRELNFGEQLRHGAALVAVSPDACRAATTESVNAVLDVVMAHWQTLMPVIAACCSPGVDWQSLRPEDGELLALAWWRVNRNFFFRRLLRDTWTEASAGSSSSPA